MQPRTRNAVKKGADRLKRTCRTAWEEGFMKGWSGNASVRIGASLALITACGVAKGQLEDKDCVLIDYEGNIIQGCAAPSSEWRLHAQAYLTLPACRAILHTHPASLQALNLALADLAPASWESQFLRLNLYEAEVWRKRLYIAGAEKPGSGNLAEGALKFATGNAELDLPCATWLGRHGLCVFARDLESSLAFTEEVEHLACVQLKVMACRGQ